MKQSRPAALNTMEPPTIKALEIKDWSATFENAWSRKRQRLGWYHAPSGCDSNGYLALMELGADGLAFLGVFNALCQLTATFPIGSRGRFVRSDGSPLTIQQIAIRLRIDPATLGRAIEALSSPEIGWLDWGSANDLPGTCQEPAKDVASNAEGVPVKRHGTGAPSASSTCAESANNLPEPCQPSAGFAQVKSKKDKDKEEPPSGVGGGSASNLPGTCHEAAALGEVAGIPPNVCEAWFLDRDAGGWLNPKGHPIQKPRSDLQSFWLKWQQNHKGAPKGRNESQMKAAEAGSYDVKAV